MNPRVSWARLFPVLWLLLLSVLPVAGGELIPRAPIRILGTGDLGGVYFPAGRILASMIREIDGSFVFVQPTEGTVQNLSLLTRGQADLAFVQSDFLWRMSSENSVAGLDLSRVRALVSLYSENLYFVVSEKSGIQGYLDADEHTLSLGPRESGTCEFLNVLLEKLGVQPGSLNACYLDLDHSIEALCEGRIDGFFFIGGERVEPIRACAQRMAIKILPLPLETIEELVRESPYLRPGVIPPTHYPFLEGPISTLSVRAILVATDDFPDELAWRLMAKILEEKSRFLRLIPGLRDFKPAEATLGIPIPLHPGAARFWGTFSERKQGAP